MKRVVLPGATIGVLGSGQLGRMFTIAARRMGYRVHVLSPDNDTPTGQVADIEWHADYLDLDVDICVIEMIFPGHELHRFERQLGGLGWFWHFDQG